MYLFDISVNKSKSCMIRTGSVQSIEENVDDFSTLDAVSISSQLIELTSLRWMLFTLSSQLIELISLPWMLFTLSSQLIELISLRWMLFTLSSQLIELISLRWMLFTLSSQLIELISPRWMLFTPSSQLIYADCSTLDAVYYIQPINRADLLQKCGQLEH